jgi:hypothetical protein
MSYPLISLSDPKSQSARLALYGLTLAARLESQPELKGLQVEYIEFLKQNTDQALAMSEYALKNLPASSDYALERSSFISVLDMMIEPEAARPLIEAELKRFRASTRPPVRVDMSEDEINSALSSKLDHEHALRTYFSWLKIMKKDGAEFPAESVAQFIGLQTDDLVRRTMYESAFVAFPSGGDALDRSLVARRLPLERIRSR